MKKTLLLSLLWFMSAAYAASIAASLTISTTEHEAKLGNIDSLATQCLCTQTKKGAPLTYGEVVEAALKEYSSENNKEDIDIISTAINLPHECLSKEYSSIIFPEIIYKLIVYSIDKFKEWISAHYVSPYQLTIVGQQQEKDGVANMETWDLRHGLTIIRNNARRYTGGNS